MDKNTSACMYEYYIGMMCMLGWMDGNHWCTVYHGTSYRSAGWNLLAFSTRQSSTAIRAE